MATHKRKSISGIDRKIASKRSALAKIKKAEREKKSVAKKLRTLRTLETKLKNAKKRK